MECNFYGSFFCHGIKKRFLSHFFSSSLHLTIQTKIPRWLTPFLFRVRKSLSQDQFKNTDQCWSRSDSTFLKSHCMIVCRTCTRAGFWAWRPWPRRHGALRTGAGVRTGLASASLTPTKLWLCLGPRATRIWCPCRAAPPWRSAPPSTASANQRTSSSAGTSERKWTLATGSACTLLVRIRHSEANMAKHYYNLKQLWIYKYIHIYPVIKA